ncbi:bifunctional diguanylate cyclase/phosphodiesterase [Bacillus rubiinfantis]|uniref:bifunctional diguanylate cyclase/phosphodiesterase n=1 Tax=Bacillus rubiinfantis TaxID=1499680 RepID=UPI0005AA24F6|nr:EAL domain-containing protein [Bacillus rubiinfantis]
MNRNLQYIWKEHVLITAASLILLLVTFSFREQFYGVFGEENYLAIHFIMESFIIACSLMITTQSWTIFPHDLSSYRLWIGSVFCAVAILEFAHMITYKGMPFFYGESSAYRATWFFIISRLTEVTGILAVVAFKDRQAAPKNRILAYFIAILYALIWIFIIFHPSQLLPNLIIDHVGTTTLKNSLQFMSMIIEVIIIFLLLFRFRSKQIFNTMLIVASIYMIAADYIFTTYKSVYDINNFVGHWFQLAGFYFLQRAVYHTAIEEPFQKQKEAEKQLEENEKFLQTIAANMGEGLIVLDNAAHVTYMNHEAERMLQWTEKELLGKNFFHTILPNSNRTQQTGGGYQDREELFCQKNGDVFQASFVETPLFEQDVSTGSVIVFRDITKQKKDQELIHYMAFYDELTDLPKSRYLHIKWEELLQQNRERKAAVFILDIDRFKKINEALGHSFGDAVLRETANRLKSKLNPWLLGRLAGDEFVLILPDYDHEQDITSLIDQIQDALYEPLPAQSLLVNVTLTLGISLYPDHGTTMEELLQHANLALVEAHSQNQLYDFYQPSLDGKALDQLVLENDLYDALENQQLYLVYQPQIDLKTGDITGVEALLLWRHPKYGIISPAKFIPIAEETGQIVPIGEWVLRTACLQVKEWHDQGLPPIMVGVNLSVRQFYQPNLAGTVRQILTETGLPPHYLELEITESMMVNIDYTIKTLQSLKDLGIHIAIDDFGTGYSSLSYLKNLKVDRIKIDQSFIRDLLSQENDTAIVSMIISMAHHLHFNVIAEGVESVKQKEILQRENCQQVQGYLFSPPLPFEEVIQQFG